MESRAKYLLVGTVVVVLVIVLVAALLWLSKAGSHRNAEYYTVYFEKQDLAGLQVDSYVLMKGIKVGTVLGLQISARNIEQVRVSLRLDEGTPVKTDTKAVIERNLLTGLAAINLVGGTQSAPRLVRILPGEDYPVIPEGRSELAQIADSIPQLLEQVSELVASLTAVFGEANRNSVSAILTNFEQLSSTLAEKDDEIGLLVTDLRNATRELVTVGNALEEFSTSANRMLKDIKPDLNDTVKAAKTAVTGISEQSARLTEKISQTSDLLVQDVHNLSQNISETAERIAAAAESFENPRAIITGPSRSSLGPGESSKP